MVRKSLFICRARLKGWQTNEKERSFWLERAAKGIKKV
jgi:hypothetical protein